MHPTQSSPKNSLAASAGIAERVKEAYELARRGLLAEDAGALKGWLAEEGEVGPEGEDRQADEGEEEEEGEGWVGCSPGQQRHLCI